MRVKSLQNKQFSAPNQKQRILETREIRLSTGISVCGHALRREPYGLLGAHAPCAGLPAQPPPLARCGGKNGVDIKHPDQRATGVAAGATGVHHTAVTGRDWRLSL